VPEGCGKSASSPMSSHTGDAPWNSSLEGKTTSKPTWRNFGCHGWYFDEPGCSLFMKRVFLCNFHLVDHKLFTTFLICSKSICLVLPIISQNLWTLERLKNQKKWGRVVPWQGNQDWWRRQISPLVKWFWNLHFELSLESGKSYKTPFTIVAPLSMKLHIP